MKSLNVSHGPSKILDRKWKERALLLHKKKLSEVKSNIRDQQGVPYTAPVKNAKREV